MLVICITDLKPSSSRLNGAVTGEAHAQETRKIFEKAAVSETGVLLLDFSGIESATASYLKRLLAPFFAPVGSPDGFPHEVSPVVTNIDSQDLKEDLEDYLAGKSQVLIVAKIAEGRLVFSALLGRLDGAAAETFRELQELQQTTALQLYERHGTRTTNQTAWNNRLVQLVDLRIARRNRQGRFWIYSPIITT